MRRYRGYDIYPTAPVPPIPGWQKFAWTYAHKDYDGPEDGRCGYAESEAACRAEIDEREGDLPEGWQAAQAARCPCRGCDDYCPCINEYAPERYGLTETEKCGECGLLASSLIHRFCQRENCPVRVTYTPGPWFSDRLDEVCATLEGGAVVSIALVNPMAELNGATTRANAALIAAAPEMFEALKAVLADDEFCELLTAEREQQARAALAKATSTPA